MHNPFHPNSHSPYMQQQRPPTQPNQQDSVVKFLLKLRNNNLNNLKNALRKVGERTHGKKDELLLRLANKLATSEGKELVRANFKPEIYKDLYEVEICGDSATNSSNPVYQHYRGLIPETSHQQNSQIPQSQQFGQKPLIPPQYSQAAPFQKAPQQQYGIPLANQQNLVKQPMGQQQPIMPSVQQNQQIQKAPEPPKKPISQSNKGAVIDLIDSDDEKQQTNQVNQPTQNQQKPVAPFAQPVQNFPLPQSSNLSKQQPISEIQSQSPATLTLAQILSLQMALDPPKLHQINCICQNPNSQYLPNTNQQTLHQLLACSFCQNQVHMSCQEANRQMKKSNIDNVTKFVCHICQFRQMDPLCQPIATILAPRLLPKLTTQEVKARTRQPQSFQEFTIKEQIYTELNKAGNFGNNKYLKVQVRCIRLDGVGFEHMWPKFGSMKINNGQANEWKMPAPPNDQKKRHDEMHDITTTIRRGKNQIDAFQEQKDHTGFFNHPGHIIAVYLVKTISTEEFLTYTRQQRVENPKTSLQRAREFFSNKKTVDSEISYVEQDMQQQIENILLNSSCPITMCPIQEATRGEHCTHLQCFDLASFVTINAKHKRWQCPICNKRTLIFYRDLFFTDLLKGFMAIQDSDPAVEDKFYLEYTLNIKTLRERGKYHDRYRMILNNDKIQDFELAEKNCQTTIASSKAQQNANEKASPMSTATTDNYPSDDHVGKRTTYPQMDQHVQELEQQNSKRQKTNNVHCPVEID